MSVGERFELEKDEELRIEVELPSKEDNILVELVAGTAEIFGTEMVVGTRYRFSSGDKFSVYTYHGCCVVVYGRIDELNDKPYKSDKHPMIQYLNIHSALEDLRTQAAESENSSKGPVVMIVGPPDVGKSTLTRYSSFRSQRKAFELVKDKCFYSFFSQNFAELCR